MLENRRPLQYIMERQSYVTVFGVGMKGSEVLKKTVLFLVKFAVAGSIIAYLSVKHGGAIVSGVRHFDYRWLAPALVSYFAHLAVCSWRWRRLAGVLGVTLSGGEALSLTMQGCFFSLVIPGGAIGGDVVKMGVLAKRTPPGARFEGAFTVLMDRIIGMIALFVLSLVLLVFAGSLLMKVQIAALPLSETGHRVAIGLVVLLCLTGLAASSVIFFHRQVEKIPGCGALMKWGDRLTHGMVNRLTAAADVYSQSWRELIRLMIASIFGVHLMTVVPAFFLLAGAGVSFSCFNVITAITIANIAGLIPLFPSGLGGRDLTAIAILIAGGIAEGSANTMQMLYTAMVILFSLSGGLFFLFDPGRRCAEEERK